MKISEDLRVKETSCTTTNILIEYAKLKGLNIEAFLKDIPYSYAYLTNTDNWIVHQVTRQLFRRLNSMLNDPMGTYNAAIYSYKLKNLGIIGILGRVFAGPDIVYRNCEKISWKFNRVYRMTAEKVTKNSALIKVKYLPGFEATKEGCRYTEGILTIAPCMWDLPKARISQIQCQAEGADECLYDIQFQKKRAFSKDLLFMVFRKNYLIKDVINELENNYQKLEMQRDELSAANAKIEEYARTLEGKVRERTKELEIAQAQLLEQERLITESHIAGGMAHEIRNALGAAKLRIDSLTTTGKAQENYDKLMEILSAMKENPEIPEDTLKKVVQAVRILHDNQKVFEKTFQEVGISTERGLQITNRVMEYSRLHMDKADDAVNLKAIFAELESTYKDSLHQKGIALQIELPESIVVKGSNNRLHSVFQNLLLNARDAILEKGEGQGKINVRSNTQEGWANVEIEDTGVGIPSESLEKIFYPFYSTKPSTGMGLGLSECQKIVRQYGGRIEVESTSGKGTIFRIFFPCVGD